MDAVEQLAEQLKQLETELHQEGKVFISFNQQQVKKGNMSFSGANGRIWITTVQGCYDVCLSGHSLTRQMSPFMRQLVGRDCHGYKQPNARLGQLEAPYWRVENIALVREAVKHYAEAR
jgi:hypothetical protein